MGIPLKEACLVKKRHLSIENRIIADWMIWKSVKADAVSPL
jgi:hypothetical protein